MATLLLYKAALNHWALKPERITLSKKILNIIALKSVCIKVPRPDAITALKYGFIRALKPVSTSALN